jgi:hypothetical protein
MIRQHRYQSPLPDDHLDDPSAYNQALHDIAQRAGTGHLLVFPMACRPHASAGFITEETPDAGAGAVARWVALLDRAEDVQANASAEDPCAQKQVRRAIDSLFLYEHQLTPDTRREAREFLWQRDRKEPLPAPATRLEWAKCRCRTCRVERAIGRPSVAVTDVILPAPLTPSAAAQAPSFPSTTKRRLWVVSEQAS